MKYGNSHIPSGSFPEFSTRRVHLRQLVSTDYPALFTLRTDPQVNRYLERAVPESVEDVQSFIRKINEGILNHQCFYWVICLNNTKKLIGTIGLWNFSDDQTVCEIGFELLPDFQSQGYMTESLSPVIQYAFDILHLKKIAACTHKKNQQSIKLLRKNGFLGEGRTDPLQPDCIFHNLPAKTCK